MVLKPQDLLVVLKMLSSAPARPWTYKILAAELGMSASEVHACVKRAIKAGLARPGDDGRPARPIARSVQEFAFFGVPYAFVGDRGGETRGIATAWASPLIKTHFVATQSLPPVWPHPDGDTRGLEVSPLYRAAPGAAQNDETLYHLLALIDVFRIGRAREVKIGRELFKNLVEELARTDRSGET
jgi:DNA-binding Lrp family transcriptional regulator